MENTKENIVIKWKNTTINKEFTIFSRAISLIQLSMVAFFYCVFKANIYNEELNLSLLKQIMFCRVVLGSPKPLECTNSFPYQILTSLVFNGRSLMWYSIPDRSSQGLLEPLKLFVYSMLPKVSLALYFLLLASLPFLFFLFSSPFFHGLKPICLRLFTSSSFPSVCLLLFVWSSLPLHHCQRLTWRWPLFLSRTVLALP